MSIRQGVHVELIHAQGEFSEEASGSHGLHEGAETVFPRLVCAANFQLTDDQEEVIELLVLQCRTDALNEGRNKPKHVVILKLESGRQEVAHVDNYALLWRQIILESRLAPACVLNLSTKAQSIELEEIEHFVCLRRLAHITLDHEEARFEAVAQDEANGAKASALYAFTARYEILAEDGAGVRDITQDLAVHEVRLVNFIAREIEHNLGGGLDVSNDALV